METLVRLPLIFLLDHLSDLNNNIITNHVLPYIFDIPSLYIPITMIVIGFILYSLLCPRSNITTPYVFILTIFLSTKINILSALYSMSPHHQFLHWILATLSNLSIFLIYTLNKTNSKSLGFLISFIFSLMYVFPPEYSWLFKISGNLVIFTFLCGRHFYSLLQSFSFPFNINFELSVNPTPLRFYGLICCVLVPLIKSQNIFFTIFSEYSSSYVRLICLSTVSSYFGRFFAFILNSYNIESEVVDMLEVLYGIFVIWISLVNGIPDILDPSKRISILTNNLWLMVLNSLFLLHEIIKSDIRENGGFQNSLDRKPVVTSLIVILGSNCVLCYLLRVYNLDSWMVTMILLVLENNVSAISLLVIYFYFVYARMFSLVSESTLRFDFLVTAISEAVKYVFSVLLLVTAFYTYVKNGRIFRLITILLHIYVNIYMKAKELHKMIWSKCLIDQLMASFPAASQAQLDMRSNMCSICIDDLECHDSCYLPCSHVFHVDCLRKWLDVKMRCPVCFAPLFLSRG